MINYYSITIPLLKFELDVIVYTDYDETAKLYPILAGYNKDDHQMAVTLSKGKAYMVINNDGNCKLSQVVHECVHIKNFMFECLGINLDINNDELEAYTVQYLYEQIMQNISSAVEWRNSEKDDSP